MHVAVWLDSQITLFRFCKWLPLLVLHRQKWITILGARLIWLIMTSAFGSWAVWETHKGRVTVLDLQGKKVDLLGARESFSCFGA